MNLQSHNKINPKISQGFLIAIKNQDYIIKNIEGIKIRSCPGVFPAQSSFSRSSKKLHSILGDLKNKRVLDIGTGTGIQAIHTAKAGAKEVVAVDISNKAVNCAKFNVQLNGFEKIITVLKSDLFKNVAKKKFDVIIANLPIVDYPVTGITALTIYDLGLKIQHAFFKKASLYLTENGYIVFSYANLQSDQDFEILEKLIKDSKFRIAKTIEKKDLGYIWRLYRLQLKLI